MALNFLLKKWSIAGSFDLSEIQNNKPQLNQLNQNLYFNKVLNSLIGVLKFEKHCFPSRNVWLEEMGLP